VGATTDFLDPANNLVSFGSRWLLAVLDPNGGLDTSFGANGLVVFGVPPSPPEGTEDYLSALALQPDGRIVVAGRVDETTVLARFEGPGRKCGDADGNGTLSVTDGVRVLRAAADLPSSCLAAFCDTDGDGAIGVTDGVRVLRAAAALPIELRCAP
jgi:hypothetical protein